MPTRTKMLRPFGAWIRKRRLAQGMSLNDLARALGYVDGAHWSETEIGHRSCPSHLCQKLADTLGLPYQEVIDRWLADHHPTIADMMGNEYPRWERLRPHSDLAFEPGSDIT